MAIDLAELVRDYDALRNRIDIIERQVTDLVPDHFAIESAQPGVIMTERRMIPADTRCWRRVHCPAASSTTLRSVAPGGWWHRASTRYHPATSSASRSDGPLALDRAYGFSGRHNLIPSGNMGPRHSRLPTINGPRDGGSIQLEINSFACSRATNGPAVKGSYHITPAIRFYRPSLQPVHSMVGKFRNVQTALFGLLGSQLAKANPLQEHVVDGGTQYFVRPGQWTRYTVHYDMSSWRLQMWIADESTRSHLGDRQPRTNG